MRKILLLALSVCVVVSMSVPTAQVISQPQRERLLTFASAERLTGVDVGFLKRFSSTSSARYRHSVEDDSSLREEHRAISGRLTNSAATGISAWISAMRVSKSGAAV